MKQKALQIFLAGVNSVLPNKLVRTKLLSESDIINKADKIYVFAIGKAAYLMAKEAEEILGNKITDGLVVTKYEHGGKLKQLRVIEAGHPTPDEKGVHATHKILKIAKCANENDLVLCLISGGASALLADYPEGSTLNDLKIANDQLINCGATISEINCVRKHLSAVKGGQLAKAIFPATTVSLILSDVIGDLLDVIASGITAPDNTTFNDALEVIKKYNLTDSFPSILINHLNNGQLGLIAETPKSDNHIFRKVHNHLIGNNKIALIGAAEKAAELEFDVQIVTDSLDGDYTEVAQFILEKIDSNIQIKTFNNPAKTSNTPAKTSNTSSKTSNFQTTIIKSHCLLFGGEPTVKVTGTGKGGRNQHLALYLATKISGRHNITILCAGTDGTDGTTDAAGAVVDGYTINDAINDGIDPNGYLSNFDSYHFFKQLGSNITIGNSGTNVMDMIVVLIG